MEPYIALLRGINVGGTNIIKMDDLKKLFENIGFTNVKTYIQSGNVIFYYKKTQGKKLEQLIEKKIAAFFKLTICVFVINKPLLEHCLSKHSYIHQKNCNTKGIYFTFLKEKPQDDLVNELNKLEQTSEFFKFDFPNIFCYYPNGYGKSKWNNSFFEKKLNVKATTRNLNTINKLIKLTT